MLSEPRIGELALPSELAVLSVGAGDTKLSFDPSRPEEVKRAGEIVRDMLRRGYSLMVQVSEDDKGPLYRRATDFDPESSEYIVMGEAWVSGDNVEARSEESSESVAEAEPESKPKRGRPRKQRVPAASTRAVAVGRTAGG